MLAWYYIVAPQQQESMEINACFLLCWKEVKKKSGPSIMHKPKNLYSAKKIH